MPLSEHEQRLLEQMEQALYAEDPKFATTMRGQDARSRQRRKLAVGTLAVVVGLALVVVGVARSTVWVAGVGFVVMLAGAGYVLTPTRARSGPSGVVGEDGQTRPRATGGRPGRSRGHGPGRRPRPSGGSFMQRLEQRWEHRRETGDF